jgi:16S rRNA (guanine527-N7)-methyltransferase
LSEPALPEIAAALGLALTGAQCESLLAYLALLQRWNTTYNLTAVRDPEAMRTQHVADCLAMIPALRRRMVSGRVMDVGSGGGLPGVVIAATMPEVQVECIDSVAKKAAFVRQVAGALKLANLRATHARVELLRAVVCDVVTSRAFASLCDFTRLTRHLLAPGAVWVAMKGKLPHDEIAQLPVDTEVFHVEQLVVPGLDAQRCLVWMRPRSGTPEN